MSDDERIGRRRFFREGFRELLKPLAHAIEPLHEAARQLERLDRGPGDQSPHSILPPKFAARKFPLNLALRPPGALAEKDFLDTCSRCGECVRVCPAQCIKIDSTNVRGGGAPYIDADAMACVACDGLVCMPACPTGALVSTVLTQIDMGLAMWHSDTCVRSRGEDCTICVDRCPLGAFAIETRGAGIEVHEKGCIGCGVCQHECPTSPKSIVVVPKVLRGESKKS